MTFLPTRGRPSSTRHPPTETELNCVHTLTATMLSTKQVDFREDSSTEGKCRVAPRWQVSQEVSRPVLPSRRAAFCACRPLSGSYSSPSRRALSIAHSGPSDRASTCQALRQASRKPASSRDPAIITAEVTHYPQVPGNGAQGQSTLQARRASWTELGGRSRGRASRETGCT